MSQEHQYLNLLQDILENGTLSNNRTGTKTMKVVGRSMSFDLMDGRRPVLPLLTTKKVFFRGVKEELLWFLRGSTNAMELVDKGVHIWDKWMIKEDETETYVLTRSERIAVYCAGREQNVHDFQQIFAHEDGREFTDSNIHEFLDKAGIPHVKVHTKFAQGDLGPIYGASLRAFPAGDHFYRMTDGQLKHYLDHLASDKKAELRTETHGEEISLEQARALLTGMGIDQLSQAVGLLKTNPDSRRILIDLWNPQAVPPDGLSPQDNVRQGFAALAFCHLGIDFITEPLSEEERVALFRKDAVKYGLIEKEEQFVMGGYTSDALRQVNGLPYPTHRLSGIFAMRSVDVALGLPFNIASYALLVHMVAQVCNMLPGTLTWNGADVHIYVDQIEGVKEQMTREPYAFPTLKLNPLVDEVTAFTSDDIAIADYQHHPDIKMPVSV